MKQLLENNAYFIFKLISSDDLEAIGMHLDANNKLIQTKINRFELPSNMSHVNKSIKTMTFVKVSIY